MSADELGSARLRLSKLDLDDDEAFSVQELGAFRSPYDGAASENTERIANSTGPFRAIIAGEPLGLIVAELFKRYGSSERKQPDVRLGPGELGLDPATISQFDTNSDGVLDSTEMIYFLRDPVPHVQLLVQLPHRKPGRPKIAPHPNASEHFAAFSQQRSTRLTLALPSIEIEIRVKSALGMTYDNQQFYKQQFLIADADNNGYLDQQEFAGLNVPKSNFQTADKNKDGMIVVDEVVRLVNRQADSDQSRVVMTVAKDGKSVFEILDADRDRRLKPRELMEANKRLQDYDRNGDGSVSAAEIDGRYIWTFEMGKPELFSRDNMTSGGRGAGMPRTARSLSGPLWFQKMDVNRDGDVTKREFLGSRQDFLRIDTNGDRLISQDEAEKIQP